ncbi:MAG TPA: porin family protein [Cyclobacteriaceae bacterium]|nr:porin family protein [Cyclobacteriaceae bacterium]HRJ81749.1 porin family protein [Cyclobacteriaceae bacterium]
MKKISLITLLLVAVVSSNLMAQVQFSVGLKGGLNFANLDVSSAQNAYDSRTGYHLGAFTLIKLSKIGIQPEIIFSQQGSKVKPPIGDSFSSNFSYVNIPVMLKLYTVAGINLQVGPQFGFLTNDPLVKDTQGNTIEDAYKKSDVSVGLGAGWDLPFGLTIDARYNLGLSKIENSATLNETKNQVIQVSLGYKLIKLGK